MTTFKPEQLEALLLIKRLPVSEETLTDSVESARKQGYELREYGWARIVEEKEAVPVVYFSKREEADALTAALVFNDDLRYQLYTFAIIEE